VSRLEQLSSKADYKWGPLDNMHPMVRNNTDTPLVKERVGSQSQFVVEHRRERQAGSNKRVRGSSHADSNGVQGTSKESPS